MEISNIIKFSDLSIEDILLYWCKKGDNMLIMWLFEYCNNTRIIIDISKYKCLYVRYLLWNCSFIALLYFFKYCEKIHYILNNYIIIEILNDAFEHENIYLIEQIIQYIEIHNIHIDKYISWNLFPKQNIKLEFVQYLLCLIKHNYRIEIYVAPFINNTLNNLSVSRFICKYNLLDKFKNNLYVCIYKNNLYREVHNIKNIDDMNYIFVVKKIKPI